MDLDARHREELSTLTTRLARAFGVRSGQFVTALQIPFAWIYLPLLVGLALTSEIARPVLAWAGGAVVVVVLLLARHVGARPRTPPWAPAALCAGCFVAVGLLSSAVGTRGYLLVILALVPSVWLAYAYLWPGAVWAVVATGTLMVTGGIVGNGGTTSLEGVYYAVFPLVTLVMTSACVLITEHWEVRRSTLRAERLVVQRALAEKTTTTLLLEAMLDSLDSAVVAFDTDGQMLLANESHLYPLSWAGEVGDSGRLIFEEDGTTPVQPEDLPSELAKRGITVDERPMWFGAPGAEQRAVMATSRPMTGPDETVHGVMAVYHDVTTLMRAMQVKDNFVETVSHELRTPLTSIIGYLELIRDDHEDRVNVLPDDTLEYLTVVNRNATHLLALVSDLLSTARSAADAIKASKVDTDLNAIVERSVESARLAFEDAGVTLTSTLATIPQLQINERRISQVVDNVLSNALKYTPAGGRVSVSTHDRDGTVALVVSDTGIGMSEADLEHIFDKFHRAQSATSLHIPGIGLGLSISKSIVEAHQGTITITSAADQGTDVTILLPVHLLTRTGEPRV